MYLCISWLLYLAMILYVDSCMYACLNLDMKLGMNLKSWYATAHVFEYAFAYVFGYNFVYEFGYVCVNEIGYEFGYDVGYVCVQVLSR